MTVHFVDIGAHKGKTARVLLSRSASNIYLHLFEPNPFLIETLKDQFEENDGVSLYGAAFHIKKGYEILYMPEADSESSSLYAEKLTSPGSPQIPVPTVDGPEFLRNLSPGPIILFSNCEGSEFDFVPPILDDPQLVARIVLWSVSFHHGQHKIPTMKPAYLKIKERLDELGIENLQRHYGNADIRAGKLDAFIDEVAAIGEQNE